jgi:hypothetical protein
VIKGTGQGAPDLRAPSPAAARLGAERAAQLDALRNILSQVKGIQISAGHTVGDKMASDQNLAARVEGTVKGFKVTDKRYYNDGGVEIDVEVPMAMVLTDLLGDPSAPDGDNKVASATPTSATGAATHSGLVIDASQLKVQPALEPRILDESGKPVYGPDVVNPDWAKKQGIAGYLKNVDDAKRNARVGEKPLVVKALKVQGSDVVISNADASQLRDPKNNNQYLAEGRVIIVTD